MPKQHNSVLEEDRRLAGAIEKHPCLYNRNMEEFNDVNCVRNAWEEISSELDFDVETLKKQFHILKKRYSRKRHDTRRAAMGGSGNQEPLESDAYLRALGNLQEYSFMNWLDPHIRYKSVKNETTSHKDNEYYQEIDASSSIDPQQRYSNSSPFENGLPSMTDVLVISRAKPEESCSSRQSDNSYDNSMHESNQNIHNQISTDNNKTYIETSPLKRQRISIDPSSCDNSKQSNEVTKDRDQLFGEMITAEIKAFPDSMKFKIKHEINNIIYKYNLQCYENQNLNR